MKLKVILSTTIALALNACIAQIDNEAMFGEYSVVVDGIENILIISRDGTYTQKQVINGELITTNSRNWVNYLPDNNDVRYSLVGFQFPSKKSSGDWPAGLENRWGKLNLCYFNDREFSECYVKRKPSSKK